jgi:signal transduction histidine kinase
MVEPEPSAPGETTRPSDDPLVSLLHAVRMAGDAASAMAAAVDVLAERLAVAWIAGDTDRDGQLVVIAASGVGAPALTGVAGTVEAGETPWRDACSGAGLTLVAWQLLGAASLPSAFLGLAAGPGDRAFDPAHLATLEIARFIGAVLDAHADRLATERLLAATGRLDWLEATRRASRTVRHDLANALTGISFYGSQLVADLPPEMASAEDAAAIGGMVARSGRLLDLLLQLGREASESEVVPLDPAAVVDAIAPVLTLVAEPCALEVGRLESMVVRASRRMLDEALLALVVDAREAAAGVESSIRVVVIAELLAEGNALDLPAGTYAAISVGEPVPGQSDGVADAPPSAAFAWPGERDLAAALAATRPGEPGRGVALAAFAARTAGGAVRVDRSPGGGARATILLPQAVSGRRGPQGAREGPAHR